MVKYMLSLINMCLYHRLNRTRDKYDVIIQNIRSILEEKNYIIDNIEHDNRELKIYYDKMSVNTKVLNGENDTLKKRVVVLENKIQLDQEKFKELFEINLNDIKRKNHTYIDLQDTLEKNEMLLKESIQREEKLQHKYCVDVSNAVKFNKQLNTIICNKNQNVSIIVTY
jgi:hypothetical protein